MDTVRDSQGSTGVGGAAQPLEGGVPARPGALGLHQLRGRELPGSLPGPDVAGYRQDMLAFLRLGAGRDLDPLNVQRPHLELYLRWMESRGFAPAAIGRRFGTVAGFYKYAVLDGNATTGS